jgi:hypothetical protein
VSEVGPRDKQVRVGLRTEVRDPEADELIRIRAARFDLAQPALDEPQEIAILDCSTPYSTSNINKSST